MFMLPELPYAVDALAPHISEKTLRLHHGKHHKTYVDKLNTLIEHEEASTFSLERLILRMHGDDSKQTIYNNAAQCWNHEFLWASMAPNCGGPAQGAIGKLVDDRFGNFTMFRDEFVKAALGHFGSGWVWLVLNNDTLEIMTTHDADLPMVYDCRALITCDLWEHAYYVDYENRRQDYVHAFVDHLINWDFANANLAKSKTQASVDIDD